MAIPITVGSAMEVATSLRSSRWQIGRSKSHFSVWQRERQGELLQHAPRQGGSFVAHASRNDT
jgi:hypothetical protein